MLFAKYKACMCICILTIISLNFYSAWHHKKKKRTRTTEKNENAQLLLRWTYSSKYILDFLCLEELNYLLDRDHYTSSLSTVDFLAKINWTSVATSECFWLHSTLKTSRWNFPVLSALRDDDSLPWIFVRYVSLPSKRAFFKGLNPRRERGVQYFLEARMEKQRKTYNTAGCIQGSHPEAKRIGYKLLTYERSMSWTTMHA